MPFSRRSGSRVIQRSNRRKTFWLASAVVTARTALPQASVVLDQSFSFIEPHTIVRTRGSIWWGSDQEGSDEEPFGALGMAVVRTQAAAIGITALPTPGTDADSDSFFLYQPLLQSVVAAGTPATVAFNAMARFDFDSKAMRKVNDGDTVAIVLENSSAADGAVYLLNFRMLIMQA